MTYSPEQHRSARPAPSRRFGNVGAGVVTAAGWLLVLTGLLGVVSFLPQLTGRPAILAVLAAAAPVAGWWTRWLRATRRPRARLPSSLLERRLHGNLDAVVDPDARPLRSVGTTAADLAARTGPLLARLIEVPGVRIFHGVRPAHSGLPHIAHAVMAGRVVILVESVAWPAGDYDTGPDGRIRCDGRYIGQSVAALLTAVGHWQRVLPRGHRVSALVVVHPCGAGELSLPVGPFATLAWVGVDDLLRAVGPRIPRRPATSTDTVAALIAATGPTPTGHPS
jgi:hypothetical protein